MYAIVLTRPQGEFHPFWHVVLTVAMPLIMSVYAGISRKAAEMAIEGARGNKDVKSHVPLSVSAMHNDLTAAETQWRDMVRIANNLDFDPSEENAQAILSRKTNVANACISTVEKAMEVVGGQGFFRSFGLERLFRDVQAAKYHPLQEKDQHQFTGEYLLRP